MLSRWWHKNDVPNAGSGLVLSAVVLVLLLPACTSGMRQPTVPTEGTNPTQATNSTQTAESTPGTSDSRSLAEALARALPPPDEEYRRQRAKLLNLDDPPQDVEFERYISPDEYAAVMVPCLTEQGIPAHPLPDGGVGYGDIPPDQALQQREALYRCMVRFPTNPLFNQPLNNDQLRRLYDYLVGDLTTCLEDQGYSVPPPPSVETFIDSYYAPGADVWSPYPIDDPRLDQEEEWYRLNQVCPQSPPFEDLYGG